MSHFSSPNRWQPGISTKCGDTWRQQAAGQTNTNIGLYSDTDWWYIGLGKSTQTCVGQSVNVCHSLCCWRHEYFMKEVIKHLAYRNWNEKILCKRKTISATKIRCFAVENIDHCICRVAHCSVFWLWFHRSLRLIYQYRSLKQSDWLMT